MQSAQFYNEEVRAGCPKLGHTTLAEKRTDPNQQKES